MRKLAFILTCILASSLVASTASAETENGYEVVEEIVNEDGSVEYTFANGDTVMYDAGMLIKADGLVDYEIVNPYGDNTTVRIWDNIAGLDTAQDDSEQDGANTLHVYSFANFVSIALDLCPADNDNLTTLLTDYLREEIMENISYPACEIESIRTDGEQAWAVVRYSFEREVAENIYFVRNVEERSALYGSIHYLLSNHDPYEVGLPSEADIKLVRDAYGITDEDGEELDIDGLDSVLTFSLKELDIMDDSGNVLTTAYSWTQEEPVYADQEDWNENESEYQPKSGEYVAGVWESVRGVTVTTQVYTDTVSAHAVIEDYIDWLGYNIGAPCYYSEIIDTENMSYVLKYDSDYEEFSMTEYYAAIVDDNCTKIVDISVVSGSFQDSYLSEILDAYGITDVETPHMIEPLWYDELVDSTSLDLDN